MKRPLCLSILASICYYVLISSVLISSIDVDDRIRKQWLDLSEKICQIRSYRSCIDPLDRSSNWTDAKLSQVVYENYQGLGAWSTARLVTYSISGNKKGHGGDSWFILLRDRRQRIKVPTRVFDEGDGSYTVAAFLLLPGNYTMFAQLWYSDCHGLQEPVTADGAPLAFENNLTKPDHCYIGALFKHPVFTMTIFAHHAHGATCHGATCSSLRSAQPAPITTGTTTQLPGHAWRTEMYHFSRNRTIHRRPCCRPPAPQLPGPFTRFLYYGDSTVRNSWDVLLYQARRPCKIAWKPMDIQEFLNEDDKCERVGSMDEVDPHLSAIMKRCTGGAPWGTVPVGTNTDEISKYFPLSDLYNMSMFVYNDTYAKGHTPPVQLPLPREFTVIYLDGWGCRITEIVEKDLKLVRPGDILIINIGAHCQRLYTFAKWKQYMDEMSIMLGSALKRGIPVIWRSTFLIEEEVFRSHPENINGYVPPAHFNTDARRILFDSYAEHVLHPLGVHTWDVYGISALGDNKRFDMFHTDAPTTITMNTDLLDLFVCQK